jgi:hypothetical protein
MRFWANTKLLDKRTKPIQERRRTKSFRLKPETLLKLEKLAESGKFRDQTGALEAAIKAYK